MIASGVAPPAPAETKKRAAPEGGEAEASGAERPISKRLRKRRRGGFGCGEEEEKSGKEREEEAPAAQALLQLPPSLGGGGGTPPLAPFVIPVPLVPLPSAAGDAHEDDEGLQTPGEEAGRGGDKVDVEVVVEAVTEET